MVDAILRTLGRLLVRQRLLEWNSAAQVQASASMALGSFVRNMHAALAITAAALFALLLAQPGRARRRRAVPDALVRGAALRLARSQPVLAREVEAPTPAEAAQLRLIARQTWQYFADLAGAADHFLPPDNLQVDPDPVIAHRTSPTNIGMYLVATVAAHEFGWIGLPKCAIASRRASARCRHCRATAAISSTGSETTTLRSLEPRYVSTVDSGNLAGCLIALSSAARMALAQPGVAANAWRGVADDVALLRRAIERADRKRPRQRQRRTAAGSARRGRALLAAPAPVASIRWPELERLASDMLDMARVIAEEGDHATLSDVGISASVLHDGIVRSGMRNSCSSSHGPWYPIAMPGTASGSRSPPLPTSPRRSPLDPAPRFARRIAGGVRRTSRRARNVVERSRAAPRRMGRDAAARGAHASTLTERLQRIAQEAHALFTEMDFRFLYDPARKLFSIGYQVDNARLDPSYYDLLASEARLASFIAIAKHDVPPEHWFRLGRTLIAVGGNTVLVSWSGSMFEYLMPSLLMDTPYGSLLDHTCRMVVDRQIEYARRRGVPWGISESAFHERDVHLTFQYSTFGVPGLGLKRGPRRGSRHRAVCDGARVDVRTRAAAPNFARLEALGGARALRVLRSARLHPPARLPKPARSRWFAPTWRTTRA